MGASVWVRAVQAVGAGAWRPVSVAGTLLPSMFVQGRALETNRDGSKDTHPSMVDPSLNCAATKHTITIRLRIAMTTEKIYYDKIVATSATPAPPMASAPSQAPYRLTFRQLQYQPSVAARSRRRCLLSLKSTKLCQLILLTSLNAHACGDGH
jgi:hypothetical protein